MKILHHGLVRVGMFCRTYMSNEKHKLISDIITPEYYDCVSQYDQSDIQNF
jgi:hypothetical protein